MERVYSASAWCARVALGGDGTRAEPGPDAQGDGAGQDPALAARLFVSGDRSQVGKSSCCLGILASLVEKLGYAPSEVAYIKPATQCESRQLVTKYCEQRGIDCVPIGPVVYVSGFTRAFLAGETKSSEEMVRDVERAVDELAARRGRRIVVVDGVGFPAVGSIVGLSNAKLAAAARAPVVLICPKGVGNAIDSFNLNRVFFEHHGVAVLGGIFNRFSLDGFYALSTCLESIRSYFEQYATEYSMYGCLPELAQLVAASPAPGAAAQAPCEKNADTWSAADEDRLAKLLAAFSEYLDVGKLVADLLALHRNEASGRGLAAVKRPLLANTSHGPSKQRRVLSAAEIVARAVQSGASKGG